MPSIPLTTGETPFIFVDTTDYYATSVTIVIDLDVPVISVTVPAVQNVVLTTGAVITLPSSSQISVSVSAISGVVVNNAPVPIGIPTLPSTLFSTESLVSTYTTQQISEVVDHEITPVLEQLSNVSYDLTQLSSDSKTIWIDTVLNNVSPTINNSIVQIMANSYHKYAPKKPQLSSRFVIKRKRF